MKGCKNHHYRGCKNNYMYLVLQNHYNGEYKNNNVIQYIVTEYQCMYKQIYYVSIWSVEVIFFTSNYKTYKLLFKVNKVDLNY
jgi:hypothetical protein